MKKESIYSDAALDTLFEALVKKFGAHHTWDNRHFPSLKKKAAYIDFCEQFHQLIGNKSYRATRMVVQAAIINSPKSRLHIAARYFAVKNGFIKI